MISKCFTIFLGMCLAANCGASIIHSYSAGDDYQFSCDNSLSRPWIVDVDEATITNNNRGMFFAAYDTKLTYKMKLYSFDSGSSVRCNKINHFDSLVSRDNVLEVLPNPDTRRRSLSEEFAPAVVETHFLHGSESYAFICRQSRGVSGRVAWIQLDANNSVTDSTWGFQSSILPKNVSLTEYSDEVKLVCISYVDKTTSGHNQYSRQLLEVVVLKRIKTITKSVGQDYVFTCDGDQETRIFSNDQELFLKRTNNSSRVQYRIKVQSFDSGTVGRCRGADGDSKVEELVVRPRPAAVPEADEFDPGVVYEHEIEEYESFEFVCNKTEDVDEIAWIKVDAKNTVLVAHHSSTHISRTMTPTAEFAGVKLVCASYSRRAFYDDGVHVADHYVRRIDKVVVLINPGADEAGVTVVGDLHY